MNTNTNRDQSDPSIEEGEEKSRRVSLVTEPVPQSEYPWWVKMSMWGVTGRLGLWKFVTMSVTMAVGGFAAAVACVAYGVMDPRFIAGGLFLVSALFLLSALMYWLTIRWVDRHGAWEPEAESDTLSPSAKEVAEEITSTGFEKRNLSGRQHLGRWMMIVCTLCWVLHAIGYAVLKVQQDSFTFSTVMNLGLIGAMLLSLWAGSTLARWAAVGVSVADLALGIAGKLPPEPLWKEWIDVLFFITGMSLAAPWVGAYLVARRR